MDLSIIIVNYKTPDLTLNCIVSIYDHKPLALDFEVILVDNASNDSSIALIKKMFSQVKFIVNDRNLGFACAVNKGLKISSGRYILLLNPDTIFTSRVFAQMAQFLDCHPQAGAAGPRLLNLDGAVKTCYGGIPTFFSHLLRFLGIREFIPQGLAKKFCLKIDPVVNSLSVDWLVGACLMLRRKAVNDIGQLDENFFLYCEDNELCYRLRDKGWGVYLLPQLEVTHIQSQSAKLLSTAARKAIYRKSVAYFYYKRWLKKNLFKKIIVIVRNIVYNIHKLFWIN